MTKEHTHEILDGPSRGGLKNALINTNPMKNTVHLCVREKEGGFMNGLKYEAVIESVGRLSIITYRIQGIILRERPGEQDRRFIAEFDPGNRTGSLSYTT